MWLALGRAIKARQPRSSQLVGESLVGGAELLVFSDDPLVRAIQHGSGLLGLIEQAFGFGGAGLQLGNALPGFLWLAPAPEQTDRSHQATKRPHAGAWTVAPRMIVGGWC